MKAWYRKNSILLETDQLMEALGLEDFSQGSIAVVGAGGKTSTIFQLAKEMADRNRRVIITTTTHMYRESGALATTPEEAERLLLQQPIVIVGRLVEDGKIRGLSEDDTKKLKLIADVLLIEADGSKHLPLKVPAETEPVIPRETDRVIVVAGLSGIGHPISECCHRAELVQELLQRPSEHILESKEVAVMIQKGYLDRCVRSEGFPGMVILNQADDLARRETAKELIELLEPYPCIMTQLQEE